MRNFSDAPALDTARPGVKRCTIVADVRWVQLLYALQQARNNGAVTVTVSLEQLTITADSVQYAATVRETERTK